MSYTSGSVNLPSLFNYRCPPVGGGGGGHDIWYYETRTIPDKFYIIVDFKKEYGAYYNESTDNTTGTVTRRIEQGGYGYTLGGVYLNDWDGTKYDNLDFRVRASLFVNGNNLGNFQALPFDYLACYGKYTYIPQILKHYQEFLCKSTETRYAIVVVDNKGLNLSINDTVTFKCFTECFNSTQYKRSEIVEFTEPIDWLWGLGSQFNNSRNSSTPFFPIYNYKIRWLDIDNQIIRVQFETSRDIKTALFSFYKAYDSIGGNIDSIVSEDSVILDKTSEGVLICRSYNNYKNQRLYYIDIKLNGKQTYYYDTYSTYGVFVLDDEGYKSYSYFSNSLKLYANKLYLNYSYLGYYLKQTLLNTEYSNSLPITHTAFNKEIVPAAPYDEWQLFLRRINKARRFAYSSYNFSTYQFILGPANDYNFIQVNSGMPITVDILNDVLNCLYQTIDDAFTVGIFKEGKLPYGGHSDQNGRTGVLYYQLNKSNIYTSKDFLTKDTAFTLDIFKNIDILYNKLAKAVSNLSSGNWIYTSSETSLISLAFYDPVYYNSRSGYSGIYPD